VETNVSASISWRGGAGFWESALGWNLFRAPEPGDAATIASGNVTLDAMGAATSLLLSGGMLDLTGTLSLSGALTLNGGTLALAGGTMLGGTLDVLAGSLLGEGGTLDGVSLLNAPGLAGLTVTPATGSANATGTILAANGLTLAPGSYDAGTFVLNPQLLSGGNTADLVVGAGATATLGPALSIRLSDDASAAGQLQPGVGDAVTLGGGGAIVSDATITSDFVATGAGDFVVGGARFSNAGEMLFAPASFAQTQFFPVSVGRFGQTIYGQLSWLGSYAPTLEIAAADFVNSGSFGLGGGTVVLAGASFDNSGAFLLTDATAQAVLIDSWGLASVGTVALATELDVQAGVTAFVNTGTLAADTLSFADNVALVDLGVLQGALRFSGTLDLGGQTLDASAYGGVTITGTVRNGTLVAGSGTLALSGATLDNVAVLGGGAVNVTGPITVIDPPASVAQIALDGTTVEVGFAANTLVGGLTISDTGAAGTIALLGGGAVTWEPTTTLEVSGTASTVDLTGGGTLVMDGRIDVTSGDVIAVPTLGGNGVIALGAGAALTIDALAADAALTVDFGATPALLVVPGDGANLIFNGLQAGDVIDFLSVSSTPGTIFVAPGATIADGTLDVVGASGDMAAVAVTNEAGGLQLSALPDGSGGTLVSVACFREGTRIATPEGEVPVERLRIGDAVLTPRGVVRRVRWLGRRQYTATQAAAQRQVRPVRIAAGAIAPGMPTRDLFVSPEHALLFGAVLVPAGALVNGVSVTRVERPEPVAYVHVELDTHDLVFAEGAAAETFVPVAGRALFDNAAEYAALYPEDTARRAAFTRRRAEHGEAVARARAVLAARADLPPPRPAGALRGHVERIVGGWLEGWACDDSGLPVALTLLLDGRPAGRIWANRYRPDLDFHGLPACGLMADVPPGAHVALQRAADGAPLPLSPEALAA
jgi:hypothetical protein